MLVFFGSSSKAQDSIPPVSAEDTVIIDTVVIRAQQYKLDIVPRGVNLTNPVISFNKTKPLVKPFTKFQVPSFWHHENRMNLNINQVAFSNWNAGGDNAVTGTGALRFIRNYKFRYLQWDNSLVMRYGWNAQEDRQPRKTDDAIRLNSTFSYRNDTLTPWYYSLKGKFNTQFTDGFNYPDRTTPISRFMAPGYLFLGSGVSFIPPQKNFTLYMSPASLKITFVLDEALANRGAFGVKRAIFDEDGNIIEESDRTFTEFGININNSWEKEIFKNVVMDHKINLYTDYIRSFGNIDIDWELSFELKVNDFIQAELGFQLIYDDDIRFDQIIADNGEVLDNGVARLQVRQFLGIGLVYNF